MIFHRLAGARWMSPALLLILLVTVAGYGSALASPLAGVPTPQGEEPSQGWIEIQDGELPIILSAPHGGDLRPPDIPDRQDAVVLDDPGSLQFTLELAQALTDLTGRRPFVIINHLDRIKLDPNRSLGLGAQGDPAAKAAWQAYHDAIVRSERLVSNQCGWGMLFDLHSNGRPDPRLEFGYGLTVGDLDRSDAALDDRQYVVKSNWRSLATWSADDLSYLLRGPSSLGGLLESHGYSVAPSPDHPIPQSDYFDGGLTVALHGSRTGGGVDSTQIEVPYTLLDDARRSTLTRLMAEAMVGFMNQAYGFDLASAGPPCTGFADVRMDAPGAPQVARLGEVKGLPACGQAPRRLCPSEPMTRGQAAEAVWKLLGGVRHAPPRSTAEGYADLPSDPGQKAAIEALGRMGLLQACGLHPRRYCPSEQETRAEAAFLGMRLLAGPSYVPPPPWGQFVDASTGSWSTWWLEAAGDAGLLNDCRTGTAAKICPQAPMSRLDFAVLADKAISASLP
jgi:hypothetical protein